MPIKKRVLHIIKTLSVGGAETNLLNLVNAMDASRFETFVAYSAGGELEECFIRAGVKLFKFAQDDHKLKSLESGRIIWRLVRFIRDQKIDIVHTHTFNAYVWGGIAAKLTGVKIIEHVHDFRYLEPSDFAKRRGTSRQYQYIHLLRNFSDQVMVLTKQNADFLSNHRLYPTKKIRELQNGIPLQPMPRTDLAPERAWRARYGIPSDAVVVLTLARMAPEKNIDLILRVAPQVTVQSSKVVFVIAGEGPLLEGFRAEVRERGLADRVKFIGFEPDVRGLLSMSDIFLLPSFLELHSIAVLEAMSMAIPVAISRDVGCHSEFIQHYENGILLDPFEEVPWAEAILRLALDEKLRHRIGEQGYHTCVERFDVRCVVKKVEAIYDELVSAHA